MGKESAAPNKYFQFVYSRRKARFAEGTALCDPFYNKWRKQVVFVDDLAN